MKVGSGKVDDLFASRIFDVRVPNVPFARDSPIKDRSPCRHLMQFELYLRADLAQCLPHAVSGDAAANRV